MNHFGDTVKFLRKNKGISQLQLAVELNVSRVTITNYESGMSFPCYADLVKLGEFFQVIPGVFFENNGTTASSSSILTIERIKDNLSESLELLKKV